MSKWEDAGYKDVCAALEATVGPNGNADWVRGRRLGIAMRMGIENYELAVRSCNPALKDNPFRWGTEEWKWFERSWSMAIAGEDFNSEEDAKRWVATAVKSEIT